MRCLVLVGVFSVALSGCREHRVSPSHLYKVFNNEELATAPEVELEVFVEKCPETGGVDGLLDRAQQLLVDERPGQAFACADRARDLVPQAVEAHIIRAEALAAMDRQVDAQLAFALALALAPNSADVLTSAAEFYVNQVAPTWDATMIGLEYARRASVLANTAPVRAYASLLEAQALNDLGRPGKALLRLRDVRQELPELPGIAFETGLAHFGLVQIDEALLWFESALAEDPLDGFVHHHLGLVHERLGDHDSAGRYFAKASALSPKEFPAIADVGPADFRRLVDGTLAALPKRVRVDLAHVRIIVEDVPKRADLLGAEPPLSPTILGLYRGAPLGERKWAQRVVAPDALRHRFGDALARDIVLYRRNILRAGGGRPLSVVIRETLLHEVGHLYGFDEAALRRMGLD